MPGRMFTCSGAGMVKVASNVCVSGSASVENSLTASSNVLSGRKSNLAVNVAISFLANATYCSGTLTRTSTLLMSWRLTIGSLACTFWKFST